MIPKEVFHYTKGSIALENILFDKKIKVGQFKYTNDPKESKEHRFVNFVSSPGEGLDASGREFAELVRKLEKVGTKIKLNEWKVLCVSKNHPDLNPTRVSLIGDSGLLLYGNCRPRMWAYYAEKHTGVCLKFNGDKLDEQITRTLSDKNKKCEIRYGDVEYDDEKVFDTTSPMISLDGISKLKDVELEALLRAYFIKNYKEVFLTKSTDWESEYEFRWLVHNQDDTNEFVPIDNVLETVFVGVDFPEVYYPSLFKCCKDLGVPARRIVWDNGIPYSPFIFKP